ncbi:hypothetical protein [uncultured Formosa sp.]|uniref:hypothetical protein n=1 Tax=uncultured Formosa sp. TaxID=255435 RepID=UPI00262A3E14|nr:hypothetical protein [uncultured Formosa sp.]
MRNLSRFIKTVVQACPYTLLGKKCVSVVNRKSKVRTHSNNKVQFFKSGIKTGRNIALVGIFCPFLWFAILSGASKDFIILNAMHSGIIVCLGLAVVGFNYVGLYFFRKRIIEKC